jgi:hypothetical protein
VKGGSAPSELNLRAFRLARSLAALFAAIRRRSKNAARNVVSPSSEWRVRSRKKPPRSRADTTDTHKPAVRSRPCRVKFSRATSALRIANRTEQKPTAKSPFVQSCEAPDIRAPMRTERIHGRQMGRGGGETGYRIVAPSPQIRYLRERFDETATAPPHRKSCQHSFERANLAHTVNGI